MTTYLPITKVRDELTSLPERLAKGSATLAVTRHGEPVLAILPWELYEALQETLEILADEELMAALRVSIKGADAGKTRSWDEVKAELVR
jgi:prevent-host-death family protein